MFLLSSFSCIVILSLVLFYPLFYYIHRYFIRIYILPLFYIDSTCVLFYLHFIFYCYLYQHFIVI